MKKYFVEKLTELRKQLLLRNTTYEDLSSLALRFREYMNYATVNGGRHLREEKHLIKPYILEKMGDIFTEDDIKKHSNGGITMHGMVCLAKGETDRKITKIRVEMSEIRSLYKSFIKDAKKYCSEKDFEEITKKLEE